MLNYYFLSFEFYNFYLILNKVLDSKCKEANKST